MRASRLAVVALCLLPATGQPQGEASHPTLLDTERVQAALRPEEIAVAFSLAEPNSFRWVLSKEHAIVDPIAGRTAIEQASTRLRDLLRTQSNRAEVTRVSAELSTMLFGGITTADDRPMVVVPHGALTDVPFEVLPVQGKMLIERHAVSYAPSLNAIVQWRRSHSNTAFRTLWDLDDRFAAELDERFNRELNLGHSSGEALRRAKVAYIHHPRYSHPFYWSSRVMFGDGTAGLVREPIRPSMTSQVLAFALSLAAVAVVVAKLRKTA